MKKKILVTLSVIACALLLVVGSVAGTIAYMTSLTATVKNTFTAGNVKITMDEAKVNEDGKIVDVNVRWTDGNEYKLLPGHEYGKDPIIHVDANSEDCWLFVKIVDEIAAIQDTTTIADQLAANGWTLVTGETDVYWHAKASKSANVKVFESFKIKGTLTNEEIAAYAGKTIQVTAYAIQADGFATAEAAWADAPTTWTTP